MSRWFKLVCLYEGNQEWMVDELLSGRLRYGWSPPGSNLLKLHEKTWEELDNLQIGNEDWSASGRYIYNQCKFLRFRIKTGDKIVVQFTQPLREFFICEITGDYYYQDIELKDFNHILPCKLMTHKPIPIFSQYVSNSLRHALSKRGKYYEIYPEGAICELEEILIQEKWKYDDLDVISTNEMELKKTEEALIKQVIELIQSKWESKYFEIIMTEIFNSVSNIEVKPVGDSGLGWDLLLTMRDPLTDEILLDDIPVQCKNYYRNVTTEKPLHDIKRCFENQPETNIAYLAILGNLDEKFMSKKQHLEEVLSKERKRQLSIRIIDQEQIAKLYLKMKSSMK